MRDRLGLGHYDARSGPVPVALMEYRVRDVVRGPRAAGERSFVAPTAVDSDPWPWFFPAPRELTRGRCMPLRKVDSDDELVDEMLHIGFPYQRAHILKLGEIRDPLPVHDLADLRNHHLLAIRIASGRDDFGEDMPG